MPLISAPYQAMNSLADSARPKSELWRTILGLILSAVFALLVILLMLLPVVMIVGPVQMQNRLAAVLNSNTAPGVLGLLFSFLPQMVGLMLAVLVLMRRSPLTLIGPWGPALRNFVKVAVPLMVFWLLVMPLSVQGDNVRQNMTLAQQLPWLPAALLGLLVQAATEEMFFRGYLQQQLAARFSARWVWLGLPSVLFGLAHYASGPSPLITVLTMLWAGFFGLACADLTARTGNIGAALALHFTNNISAILLVGMAGNIGGLTLYNVTLPPGDIVTTCLYLGVDCFSLLVAWLISRLILRR